MVLFSKLLILKYVFISNVEKLHAWEACSFSKSKSRHNKMKLRYFRHESSYFPFILKTTEKSKHF